MDYTDEVLAFWFDELAPEAHFRSTPQVDAAIRDRFAHIHRELHGSLDFEAALATPRTALATVIVLDQFPRNMFRASAQSFASDQLALGVAKASVKRGLSHGVELAKRLFLYLPYEHSENLADQWASVHLMATLGDPNLSHYAEAHRLIIERFGRFPHRNEALGRRSTAAEIAFLEQPGSSF